MRVRKMVWGGIFGAIVVFTAAVTLDLSLNNASIASAIYVETVMETGFPAEAFVLLVLSVPVIAAFSGIMFLIYFVKSRKQRKQRKLVRTAKTQPTANSKPVESVVSD